MPSNVVITNSSGFAIGDVHEGGQIQGRTEWIVATPEGVLIGIRCGTAPDGSPIIKRLIFTASGYGEVA